MTQQAFSFAAIPSSKARKKAKPVAKLTTQAIAMVIDPEAWKPNPAPSRERLVIELRQAREEIRALREKFMPGMPLDTPLIVHRDFIPDDTVARQEAAMEAAILVFAMCKQQVNVERRWGFVIRKKRQE